MVIFAAGPIIKLGILEGEAVFIVASVVRLSRRPELVLPGGRVSPLPDTLLLNVASSNPGPGFIHPWTSFHHFQNKILGGIGVDRGQMASFSTAKVPSRGPVFLLVAKEVAMVSVRFPTFRAGFDAFVLAAG